MGLARRSQATLLPALLRVPAVLAFALFTLGCAREETVVTLARWELTSPTRATVELPAHLDDFLVDRPATYTLTSEVALPIAFANHDLTLDIADLPALATLRVNGLGVARLEHVTSERYRGRGPIAWRIPASQSLLPSLRLEITVDNEWTQSAWIETVPRLSATEYGDPWYAFVREWNDASALLALGTLTPIGFIYLAMFLQGGRRWRAHAWFAVQALGASYLPCFQLCFTQVAFGRYDAAVLAVATAGAALGSVYFTHAQFGLPSPSRLWALLMAAVASAGLVWSGPFVATKRLSPLIDIVFVLVVAHQLRTLGRLSLMRSRPENARTFLASWVGLGAASSCDMLQWVGLGDRVGGLRNASAGLGLFGMLQALAISREHISSLLRSDDLNTQLQARVRDLEANQREVASLNDELRRQIAERSSQLADALMRLGGSAVAAIALGVGEVIKGRYEVMRQVGAGAMGVVYEVARLGDGKRFALKVLSGVSGAREMARFAREAELVARMNHPNVVAIVDVGIADSGAIFTVMELVQGGSLLELAPRYGDARLRLDLLSQLAEGLAAIHDMGIVHRDLKPANVLVENTGANPLLKISDFGLSTMLDSYEETLHASPRMQDDKGSLTQTGVMMGTPVYMAPELAFGAKNARPASDVFSFGVIVHELLRGERPWSDAVTFSRLRGAPLGPAPRLASLCPDLDPSLAEALDACLRLDPAERPSARDLAEALRRA